ncbi:hypothetical protein NFF89_01750 [Proteus mirabilis]|uniref:hypothetical protein n=1 Tax=Proteus mirabilis TaxID=584 RepID=UPI00155F14BF|nr:hypothetical protein [Proteus mirabilis]MDF7210906.1 hypothetical protein [Proteus mirabilis]MDF7394851.1 hypothetical protein [Proteus mirabilis]QKG50017.1 hypothetical protein HRD56_14565 [Proteus mirabilis]UZE64636.1 hypothetical protein ONR70_04750 [Proteus mirabilis]
MNAYYEYVIKAQELSRQQSLGRMYALALRLEEIMDDLHERAEVMRRDLAIKRGVE